jgi:hypothetical protein
MPYPSTGEFQYCKERACLLEYHSFDYTYLQAFTQGNEFASTFVLNSILILNARNIEFHPGEEA